MPTTRRTDTGHSTDEPWRWADLLTCPEQGLGVGHPDGKTLETVNPAFTRMLGYTTEELIGKSILDVFAPEHRAEAAERIRLTREQGRHTWESRYLRKDGTTFAVLVDATAGTSTNGAVHYRIVNIIESMERKRAGEALREDEERFQATFEQAAVGLAHVDMAGQWLLVNRKLCDIVGYSREELMERTFAEITHPDDLESDQQHFQRLLSGDVPSYSLQKRYMCKDGSLSWVNLTVSLVRDASGEPKYSISVIEDITERKRIEAQLAETRRRLGESEEAARLDLAHELHDGVVQELIVLSYQMAQGQRRSGDGQMGDREQIAQLLKLVERSRLKVLAVTAQLRGLIGELRPAGLDELGLTAALEGYIALVEREAGSRALVIVRQLDMIGTGVPRPVALCLFRVAQEAIRNAVRHAHGRRITVVLQLRNGEVELRVSDDGVGFEAPARLSRMVKEDHFGLAGMSERVNWVGGRLDVRSSPGQGTDVVARIPLGEEGMP